MISGETTRTFYNAARAEVIQRLQLRDYVLLGFLGFTGVIFSFSFGAPDRLKVLLAIPFLSLGAAILVSQHNLMAAVLGNFLTEELGPIFKLLKEDSPQWDNSATFHKHSKIASNFRFIGHNLIIFIPCIVALCVNFDTAFHTDIPQGHVWSFIWEVGAACVALSAYTIWYSHKKRINLYNNRGWESFKFAKLSDPDLDIHIEKFNNKDATLDDKELLELLELQQLRCEKLRRALHSKKH